MSGKSESSIEVEDRTRVLNARAYLSHHAHFQNGRVRQAGCGFCSQGVDGVVTYVAEKVEKDALPEDSGSDEEGAAASAPSDEKPWYVS